MWVMGWAHNRLIFRWLEWRSLLVEGLEMTYENLLYGAGERGGTV